jgi:multidrug efflux pump
MSEEHRFNLSRWAVTHPAFVTFLILASSIAGLQAYFQMGRAEDPSFTIKTGIVSAVWPGATSEEMQQQVADIIEVKLRETPYLDFLQTYCLPDRMLALVQLKDSVQSKQVPGIWYQVRKKLGDIKNNLPQGVIGPNVNDEYGDVYSALYAFKGADYSAAELKRMCEDARKKLLRIDVLASETRNTRNHSSANLRQRPKAKRLAPIRQHRYRDRSHSRSRF